MRYKMIKVMLVDDQKLLIDLLAQMLQNSGEIEVVARASNGEEAIDLAKIYNPDVVLMDIIMPVCDGIEATKKIKKENNHVKILILTTSVEEDVILKALESGADGYLLKDTNKEDLVIAIKGVFDNMEIIHQSVRDIINDAKAKKSYATSGKKSVLVNNAEVFLSDRELKIIGMAVDGKNATDIAAKLSISEEKIRDLMTGLFSKLALYDLTHLAIFALRNHLI
jgi:DNA-binding NarL/FixJ family response regulator